MICVRRWGFQEAFSFHLLLALVLLRLDRRFFSYPCKKYIRVFGDNCLKLVRKKKKRKIAQYKKR